MTLVVKRLGGLISWDCSALLNLVNSIFLMNKQRIFSLAKIFMTKKFRFDKKKSALKKMCIIALFQNKNRN